MRKAFGRAIAVDGVDLVVGPGEVVALVGPNGSGKTTLLLVSAGLVRADAGTVEVAGAAVSSRQARAATALVPDVPRGLDELTVREHLELARALAGVGEDDAGAVETLGLDALLDRRVGALSRGQRRRVELAAALGTRPALLLVDEATATLDRASAGAAARLLRAQAESGGGALVATHDLAFVREVADRVHLVRAGRLVGGGPGCLVTTLAGLERSGGSAGPEPRSGRSERETDAALAR